MNKEELRAFGQTLKRLRKNDGYTQEQLAEKIVKLHAQTPSQKEMRLDGNRISKWEKAFEDKQGRILKPRRDQLLYLIELFAAQLNWETVQVWATQAGYMLNRTELEDIFARTKTATVQPVASLSPELAPRLFGVAQKFEKLRTLLTPTEGIWLLAICGIGGIGKTSMAEALCQTMVTSGQFQAVAWVSAKQEQFLPTDGIKELQQPALDEDTLVNTLLEKLTGRSLLARPLADKIVSLIEVVKQKRTLIVVDNLETAVDYEALLPLLRRLSNPSKVLLTSRMQLHGHEDVYCVRLDELTKADAFEFLRYEGQMRGLEFLLKATTEHLESIYATVGGNPLALKLVVGQLAALPLAQVVESLREAQGKQVDELYTYIYWQAWNALDEAGKHTLLVMPLLAQGGTFEQLVEASEMEAETLRPALTQLVTRSLVETRGDIAERRYVIHRLTETFLLNEVIKW